MENKKPKLSFSDIFAQYTLDNSQSLSGVAVIATTTALFLNLDISRYPIGLRELQLLLLLFLSLSIFFLTITTFLWIARNADSYFGGLIGFSLIVLLYRLLAFISGNFGKELKEYLLEISICATAIIYFFLIAIQKKYQDKIENLQSKYRPLLYSLSTFLFFYFYGVGTNLFNDLSHTLSVSSKDFYKPVTNGFAILFATWIFIIYFAAERPEIRRHIKIWFFILALPAIGFIFYFLTIFYSIFVWHQSLVNL